VNLSGWGCYEDSRCGWRDLNGKPDFVELSAKQGGSEMLLGNGDSVLFPSLVEFLEEGDNDFGEEVIDAEHDGCSFEFVFEGKRVKFHHCGDGGFEVVGIRGRLGFGVGAGDEALKLGGCESGDHADAVSETDSAFEELEFFNVGFVVDTAVCIGAIGGGDSVSFFPRPYGVGRKSGGFCDGAYRESGSHRFIIDLLSRHCQRNRDMAAESVNNN